MADSLFEVVEAMGGPKAPAYDQDRLARIDRINHPENYGKRTIRQRITLGIGAVALVLGLGAGAVYEIDQFTSPSQQHHQEVECHTVDLTPPTTPNGLEGPADVFIALQQDQLARQNPLSGLDCRPVSTTIPK